MTDGKKAYMWWSHRHLFVSPCPISTDLDVILMLSEETAMLYFLNLMVAVTTWRKREVTNRATVGLFFGSWRGVW